MDKLLPKNDEQRPLYTKARLSKERGIPEGAIRMDNLSIIKMQTERLKSWKPQSDIWAFKYGRTLVGSTAAISSIMIMTHFRKKFVLMDFARLATYIPSVCIPTLISVFAHENISKSVMLQSEVCPTCLETRAGIYGTLSSVIYTTVISPLLCIGFSRKYHTYLLKNNFQPNIIHAAKSSQMARNCFVLLAALNFGVSFFVTYQQGRTLEHMEMKEAEVAAKKHIQELYGTE